MLYTLLKLLHVLGAIVWVGGSLVLALSTIRHLRQEEPGTVAVMLRQNAFVGQYAMGPAAALTLLAGIAMMVVGKWPPTIWIVWGFLGLLGSAALGAGILRRELNGVAAGGDPRVAASRMARIAAINLTLLVSVVAAMVFKPTLG
jgi:uncharacterized membrane protein